MVGMVGEKVGVMVMVVVVVEQVVVVVVEVVGVVLGWDKMFCGGKIWGSGEFLGVGFLADCEGLWKGVEQLRKRKAGKVTIFGEEMENMSC